MYWWDRYPERLEYELEALDLVEIRYKVDDAAKLAGQLRITAWPLIDGKPIEVEAIFPDLYPEFRFEVTSQELRLGRHQHRLGGNLCLIGRRTENWDQRHTLAMYLTENLHDLVDAVERGPGSVLEERQAEPESDYFTYEQDAAVIVDGSWSVPDEVLAGTLVVGLLTPAMGRTPLRGVVLEVRDANGAVLCRAHPKLVAALQERPTLTARWARLEGLPEAYGDAYAFREHLRVMTNVSPGRALLNPDAANAVELVGALFPEEHQWPDERGDGWVFVVSQQTRIGKRGRIRRYFCRAERGGPQDVRSRIPDVHLLGDKCVAIFGLGALGGPIAQELGRVGLEGLHLNDPDRVDPGTSSRTPYSIFHGGTSKPTALGNIITNHMPFTEVKVWAHRVGGVRHPDAPHEMTVLDEILNGADLVVDATAEIGVQMALSRICAERKIPYVLVSATPGAWGGTVAHFLPGSADGCALCWAWARQSDDNLIPPSAPEGEFQPPGCADPTFTGAGHDLLEVSMEAVRTVCDILQDRQPTRRNVAVCSLRDPATGERTTPQWREARVPRHPDCRRCASG